MTIGLPQRFRVVKALSARKTGVRMAPPNKGPRCLTGTTPNGSRSTDTGQMSMESSKRSSIELALATKQRATSGQKSFSAEEDTEPD